MALSALTPKTVVVADDTAHVRDRFSAVLQDAGHRAIGIKSAPELLSRLQTDLDRIDLVVLDLQLTPSPGVELVRSIRKLDAGKLPILVFSGSISSAEQVRELTGLGVAGYVNEYSAAQHILPSLAPHLFPDSFNRRTSTRVMLGIPVAYRFDNTIATALTLNLSKGGLGVRTMSPLTTGTQVRVRFRLPGSDHDIEAASRVAWSDRRVGMGLQFEQVDSADQSAIDEFVDQYFFTKDRRGEQPPSPAADG